MLFLLLLLILFGVVASFLGTIFCSTLFYWYESLNTPCEDIPTLPPDLRGRTTIFLLALFGTLVAPLAFVFHTLQAASSTRFRKNSKNSEQVENTAPPVLLIHGLYHNASAWYFMRRTLAKAGFRRSKAISYRSVAASPEDLAADVEKAIQEMEALYPGEKPLLIGHSLGGLLIRAWLNEGHEHRISGVLTLGTPHRGSKMGALAPERLGRRLMPGDPFFAELERREKPRSIPCVALASAADTMVLPPSGLVPTSPGWQFRLTPLSGHLGMLFCPAVRRMAAWELTRMLPEA